MELKNFVDFAYSLVNMTEVKDGVFIKPSEMVFVLDSDTHRKIHVEIKIQKGDDNMEDIDNTFDVEIFGVNFKFLTNVD